MCELVRESELCLRLNTRSGPSVSFKTESFEVCTVSWSQEASCYSVQSSGEFVSSQIYYLRYCLSYATPSCTFVPTRCVQIASLCWLVFDSFPRVVCGRVRVV